jgi:hypothetical protein
MLPEKINIFSDAVYQRHLYKLSHYVVVSLQDCLSTVIANREEGKYWSSRNDISGLCGRLIGLGESGEAVPRTSKMRMLLRL